MKRPQRDKANKIHWIILFPFRFALSSPQNKRTAKPFNRFQCFCWADRSLSFVYLRDVDWKSVWKYRKLGENKTFIFINALKIKLHLGNVLKWLPQFTNLCVCVWVRAPMSLWAPLVKPLLVNTIFKRITDKAKTWHVFRRWLRSDNRTVIYHY